MWAEWQQWVDFWLNFVNWVWEKRIFKMGGWSNWRKKALFQVLPQCSYVPSGTAASYEFKYMYYDAILCVAWKEQKWWSDDQMDGRKLLISACFLNFSFDTGSLLRYSYDFNSMCYDAMLCVGWKEEKVGRWSNQKKPDFFMCFLNVLTHVHIWVQIRCTMICCVWVERKKRMWADNGRNEAISFSAIPQFLFL